MNKPLTTITWLRGEKKLKPVEYRLTKNVIKDYKIFKIIPIVVKEYFIETDYYKLGPFGSKEEAYEIMSYGTEKLIDCTGE